jgi:hypothetical protein
MYWVIALAVAVALFALDWWVSGSPDEHPGARSPRDEIILGEATVRVINNREGAGTA